MADAIPHEALARAVRAAFGDATRVVATTLLAADASSRRYARLTIDGGGAPRTVVAMLLGADRFPLGSDEMRAAVRSTELPFVAVGRYLASRGLPVPAIYHDASRDYALVLVEDIGDTTLWAAVSALPADAPRRFEDAIDLLVALQVAGRRDPDPECPAFQQRFDARLAGWELEHFVEHGIETRHGRKLSADERAAILAGLAPVAAPFAAADPVLAHRDFMAWNIHVQDGSLRLIDFQDALLAPDAYDLGALLTDRTTASVVGPALEAALIARFARRRAEAGFPTAGDLAGRYRACALHRALKVIGRFHYLECVLGKAGYLAYLPAVYAVARRMLDGQPALAAVRARIAAHVPELA